MDSGGVSLAEPELIHENAIAQRGILKRVRRWWKGVHPDKGVITKGWTGWETVEKLDRFSPMHTFTVARPNYPVPISKIR